MHRALPLLQLASQDVSARQLGLARKMNRQQVLFALFPFASRRISSGARAEALCSSMMTPVCSVLPHLEEHDLQLTQHRVSTGTSSGFDFDSRNSRTLTSSASVVQ